MKLVSATVFALAATFIVAAQSTRVDVTIARGRCVASVGAERTEPYAGGPWAAIPASCLNDSPEATARDFRIRAWKEAESTRVVVFAVVTDATAATKERETQIATFLMSSGQSVNVTQTAEYNAAPVTVSTK